MPVELRLDDALQVLLVDHNLLRPKPFIFVVVHGIHVAHDAVRLSLVRWSNGGWWV
jgi:hypothetical protein